MKTIIKIFSVMVLTHGFSYAQNVVGSEATTVAAKFVSELRQTEWTNDSVSDVKTLTRSNNGTIYEIVGYDGSSVLLSGRKECEPILGYIPSENKPFAGALTDHFDKLPDGLRALLEEYSEQIAYCSNHNVVSANVEKWNRLLGGKSSLLTSSSIYIQPLINTQWGQAESNDGYTGAYNHYCFDTNACNNCPAGCVAVAMAQIMKYWTFPELIPWRCEQFDWYNMPDQIIASNNSYYHTQKEATSKLIYNCGTSVHTNYCPDSNCQSGIPYSSMGDVIVAMRDTFGFSESMELKYRTSESNWDSLLLNELQHDRPLFYFGTGTGGHAFICDGCIADPNQQLYYFHFNWGWTGTADGIYSLSALTPNNGQPQNFSVGQGAIFNIYPANCFQNIVMECDKSFAHTVSKTYSAVNNFQNNYHKFRLASGAKVFLRAGDEILLTEGFYAAEGSLFQATIAPCSSTLNSFPDNFIDNDNDSLPADTLPVPKSLRVEESIANNTALVVYPNPTDDLLFIELSGGAGITNVALYDLQGRIMNSPNSSNSPFNSPMLDVKSVPAGVYILRVTDTDGKEYHWKIVKK